MNIDQLYELLAINENLGIMLELLAKYGLTSEMYKIYTERKVSADKFKKQEIQSKNVDKLITKHIDSKYAYANYEGIEVMMMVSNGYMNATKLCKLGGLHFKDWNRTQFAQKLVSGFETTINSNCVISIKQGGNQQITGSYVHPKLIPHIQHWIFKNSNNQYHVSGYVYCIAFRDICKIGMTTKQTQAELEKYLMGRYSSAYGLRKLDRTNFRCIYCEDVAWAEKVYHEKFASRRIENTEIFVMSIVDFDSV